MRWYESLRRRAEIAFVRQKGRCAAGTTLSAYAVPSPGASRNRIVVSVGRAVGDAVTRNRVRRRIKGALDARPAPNPPLRVVFVVRREAESAPFAQIAADVDGVMRRLAGAS